MVSIVNQPPSVQHVSIDEILETIGIDKFETIIKELNADKGVIKFPTMTIFKLVVYNLLQTERISLRTMSETSSSSLFTAMLNNGTKRIAYTTVRHRLMKIKPAFFEGAFEHTNTVLNTQYSEKELKSHHIKRFDSTMIATFSHLISGMKVGNTSKGKTQVKLTTEFTDSFDIRMTFFKDQAHLSEETAMAEVIEKATHGKKDLIVFDRGLKDRKKFVGFDEQNLCFVTRLTDNPRFKVIRVHSDVREIEHPDLTFVQDSIVHLYGNGNKIVEHEFRLIEMIRKSDNQTIYLLTSSTITKPTKDKEGDDMILLSTLQVAEVYKSRWDIEVLFKFLKQEINLGHFVCNDINAVKAMIYCQLIVAMLLLIYKKKNEIKSFKIAKLRFFNELQRDIIVEIFEAAQSDPSILELLRVNQRKKSPNNDPKIKNKIF